MEAVCWGVNCSRTATGLFLYFHRLSLSHHHLLLTPGRKWGLPLAKSPAYSTRAAAKCPQVFAYQLHRFPFWIFFRGFRIQAAARAVPSRLQVARCHEAVTNSVTIINQSSTLFLQQQFGLQVTVGSLIISDHL
jgi:hypothetical protein